MMVKMNRGGRLTTRNTKEILHFWPTMQCAWWHSQDSGEVAASKQFGKGRHGGADISLTLPLRYTGTFPSC